MVYLFIYLLLLCVIWLRMWSFLVQVTCKLEKNLYSTEGGYSIYTCWLEEEEWLWYLDQLYPFWFFYSLLISVWKISIDLFKFTFSLVKVCDILISYLNLNLIYIKIRSILYIWFLFWCLLCLFRFCVCVCVCVCLLEHFVILLWTQFWFWTIKSVQKP